MTPEAALEAKKIKNRIAALQDLMHKKQNKQSRIRQTIKRKIDQEKRNRKKIQHIICEKELCIKNLKQLEQA